VEISALLGPPEARISLRLFLRVYRSRSYTAPRDLVRIGDAALRGRGAVRDCGRALHAAVAWRNLAIPVAHPALHGRPLTRFRRTPDAYAARSMHHHPRGPRDGAPAYHPPPMARPGAPRPA